MKPQEIFLPGTMLEQRYGIIGQLTRGSKNIVYEGHHRNLKLKLIIKTPREIYEDPIQARQQSEHFRMQAQILARLTSPHIARVLDTFNYQGYPVMVMEKISGRSLEEIVHLAPKRISQKRILTWVEQLLDALDYLHSQDPPIIVRDLSPANIVLARDGRLKLVDFGLVKLKDEKGAGTHEIVRGVGQEGFTPIEQVAYSKTDASSDLYALGATTYFLLTAQAPPSASTRILASADPLLDPRECNETVTEEIWCAIKSLMQIRTKDRPQSVSEARVLFHPPEPPEKPQLPALQVCADHGESPPSEPNKDPGRRCVDCDIPLHQLFLDQVEIDRCAQCGGIWLDRGELADLVEMGRSEENTNEGPEEINEDRSGTLMVEPVAPVSEPKFRIWAILRDLLNR